MLLVPRQKVRQKQCDIDLLRIVEWVSIGNSDGKGTRKYVKGVSRGWEKENAVKVLLGSNDVNVCHGPGTFSLTLTWDQPTITMRCAQRKNGLVNKKNKCDGMCRLKTQHERSPMHFLGGLSCLTSPIALL